MKQEVEQIYNDEEISYCLPDMKLAGYRFMSCTIHEAHLRYMEKCTTKHKVAEKTFNLSRGCSEGTENRAASYANYSGMLSPEITVLHEKAIRSVYERDVLRNQLNGAYMGMWQFHHAAEVFGRPIASVYLRKTNKILRKDMHRMVLPLNSSNDNKCPVYVMWTPISLTMKHADVKHFVALMKKVNNFIRYI